jgi:hypothetical protein
LDINVGIEESIHFVVESSIKSGSSVPGKSDVFTGVLTGREEAPGSTVGLILRKIGWFPATFFGLAKLLIDSNITAVCSETLCHITLLRKCQENQGCQCYKRGLHAYM